VESCLRLIRSRSGLSGVDYPEVCKCNVENWDLLSLPGRIEPHQIGSGQIESDQIGLDQIEPDQMGLNWIVMNWIVLDQIG